MLQLVSWTFSSRRDTFTLLGLSPRQHDNFSTHSTGKVRGLHTSQTRRIYFAWSSVPRCLVPSSPKPVGLILASRGMLQPMLTRRATDPLPPPPPFLKSPPRMIQKQNMEPQPPPHFLLQLVQVVSCRVIFRPLPLDTMPDSSQGLYLGTMPHSPQLSFKHIAP